MAVKHWSVPVDVLHDARRVLMRALTDVFGGGPNDEFNYSDDPGAFLEIAAAAARWAEILRYLGLPGDDPDPDAVEHGYHLDDWQVASLRLAAVQVKGAAATYGEHEWAANLVRESAAADRVLAALPTGEAQ